MADLPKNLERASLADQLSSTTPPEKEVLAWEKELGEVGRATEQAVADRERATPSWQSVASVGHNQVGSDQQYLVKQIEGILEEDLNELYFALPADQRVAFKQAGEVTSQKVATLLQAAVIKVKEIIKVITDWLKMIPGINRYFLEQEIKIKTDKLLRLVKKDKEFK